MRGTKWLVAGMAIAVASLGGCATTSNMSAGNSRTIAQTSFDEDVDFQKMAIITEDALSRGYKIVWVHPPQKRKAASTD